MQTRQQGFTLIELVVVIVILAILAVTALPKFIDLRTEAADATTDGVAGAISSAAAINYGAYTASGGLKGTVLNATNVCTNAILGNLLQTGLPTGYTISGTLDCDANASGFSGPCTVNGPQGQSASATVICAK